jgi:VIT1/CCC1 family predicted Fe2+/Mn2+ transporter
LPLLAIGLFGSSVRVIACVVVTILALAGLGALGARLGGAPEVPAVIRVVFWGAVAMGATAAIGALVGAAV